ncbi:hypothetical protein RclHR1_03470001 [Rhizophagus clarus]|uniref:Uncharacterized protein n=1 Tax=Rhizophagus clarus TaxID=94130 RepID=A0A2Z6S4S9_9GLOM|nr:hypothetical protein RclHR1_03470001 [Rhizophagus clarus]
MKRKMYVTCYKFWPICIFYKNHFIDPLQDPNVLSTVFWTYNHKRTLTNASFRRSGILKNKFWLPFRRSETLNIQARTLFQRFRTSIQSRLKPELHFEAERVISKVQNSNSKRTEVFEGLKLHSEADYCPELHFEADHCLEVLYRRTTSGRSRPSYFEGLELEAD